MEEKPLSPPALDELRESATETINTLVAAGVDLHTVSLSEVKRALVHRICERRQRSREANSSSPPGDDDDPWRPEPPFVREQDGRSRHF